MRTPSISLLLLFACGCTACGPSCADSAEVLEAALAAAEAGDAVCVGEHSIAGAFVVPDGVRVYGAGSDRSILHSVEGGEPVLRASTEGTVTIDHLGIAVDHGGVGARGAGTGTLVIEDSAITVSRGIGIGLDGCSAELRAVALHGPITPENASSVGTSPTETGTFGIIGRGLDGRTVSLSGIEIAGFAVAGAALSGGTIEWVEDGTRATISSIRGTGVVLYGSDASLVGLRIEGLISVPRLLGVGVSASGGSLDVAGLVVLGGDGFGLFGQNATVELTEATFGGLALGGVRVQGGSLSVSGLTAMDNGGAGVLAIDAVDVDIADATIRDHHSVPIPSGSATFVSVADGVQIVRATADAPPLSVALSRVTLVGNARTGLLLDALDGPVATVTIDAVSVDAPTGATGAIAQRAMVAPSWDAAITRTGAAIDDDRFVGLIDPVGIMMPPGDSPPGF